MEYNVKHMLGRRLIALSLTLAIISSSLLPAFAQPAKAQFDAPAIVAAIHIQTVALIASEQEIDGKNWVLRAAKLVAMTAAKAMIDRIVASTVKWAQSGFDGNPAYVTNPGEYFGNIADGVAGEFIKGSDLGLLCSPFQASIKLSLTAQYYEPRPFQCTLTGVIGNIENFYGDFTQGGWDAWFSMTQEPTNNPYGAYLKAKIELDSRLAKELDLKKSEYDINKGFLSWKKCAVGTTTKYDIDGNPDGETCILGQEKTVTPGSVISEQLNQALPAGLNKLINAQDIDQVIGAFAAGLLQRYVFGPKGLFNNDPYNGAEGKSIAALNPAIPSDLFPPGTGGPDGTGGGEEGNPTEWTWNDHGGPAFQSSACPGINPQTYFSSLIGSRPIGAWQQALKDAEGGLWGCGIGQQKSSGGEVRGRLYLPTASCPDASPLPGEEGLGVRQNSACWAHEVDVLGFSGNESSNEPPATP